MADIPKQLVLTFLNNQSAIVDAETGLPLPYLTQVINNAWTNITNAYNNLTGGQEDLTAIVNELATLNGVVTTVNGQVTNLSGQVQNFSIPNSYTVPTKVLTATTNSTPSSTITIAAHNRAYTNGSTVAVSSGSIGGLSASTTYWVYYNDPTAAGGSVTYSATTTNTNAAQINGIHCVGAITTPANTAGGTVSGTDNIGTVIAPHP